MTSARTSPTVVEPSLLDIVNAAWPWRAFGEASAGQPRSLTESVVPGGKQWLRALDPLGQASSHATRKAELREVGSVVLNRSAEPREWGHNFSVSVSNALESRLASFLSLLDDWDGEGARAIPKEAIFLALNYLREMLNTGYRLPTQVAPSPDGEVLLYWTTEDKYLELNFSEDGLITMCVHAEDDRVDVVEERSDVKEDVADASIYKVLQQHVRDSI